MPTSGAFEALGAMAHQLGQYAQRQKEQRHQDELAQQQLVAGLVTEGVRSGRVDPQAAMTWMIDQFKGKGSGRGTGAARKPGTGGQPGPGGAGDPRMLLNSIIGGIMHHAPKAEVQGPGMATATGQAPAQAPPTAGGMPPWRSTAEVAEEEATGKARGQEIGEQVSYEGRVKRAREQGLTGEPLKEFLLTGKWTMARPSTRPVPGRPTPGPDLPPDAVDFNGTLIPDEGRTQGKYWARSIRVGPDGEPQEVYSPTSAPAGGTGGVGGASFMRELRLTSPELATRVSNQLAAIGIPPIRATEEQVVSMLGAAGQAGLKADVEKQLNAEGLARLREIEIKLAGLRADEAGKGDDWRKVSEATAGLTGDDLLGSIPEDKRQVITGIASYDYPMPVGGFALSNPKSPWLSIFSLVKRYDPSFNAAKYQARAKVRTEFTSGNEAKKLTSLNQAVGHIQTLLFAKDALGNGNWRSMSWLKNNASYWFPITSGARTRQAELAGIRTDWPAVTTELATIFKQSGATDQEIQEWRNTVVDPTTATQNDWNGFQKNILNLMRSRLLSLRGQYKAGMGGKDPDFPFVRDEARDILKSVGFNVDRVDPLPGTGGTDPNPPSSTPPPPPPGPQTQGAGGGRGGPTDAEAARRVRARQVLVQGGYLANDATIDQFLRNNPTFK